MNEIFLQIFLGMIQGITEWIPVSSSGMLTIALVNFKQVSNMDELFRILLFLHLGTFFAALIYFKTDVANLIQAILNYKNIDMQTKKILHFLLITTLISGILGFLVLKIISNFAPDPNDLTAGRIISFFVGFFLILTGIFQIKKMRGGLKTEMHLTPKDGILLGVVQGISVIPGLSRSGATVSTLLFKKFDDVVALRLSFLMSMPLIIGGNILLNMDKLAVTSVSIYGLLTSFVVGILSISLLMRVAKKVNFGYFALGFGIIMMLSVLF